MIGENSSGIVKEQKACQHWLDYAGESMEGRDVSITSC